MNYTLCKTEADYEEWLKAVTDLKEFIVAEKNNVYSFDNALKIIKKGWSFHGLRAPFLRLENSLLSSPPVGVGVKFKEQVLRKIPLQSRVLQQYQTKYNLKEGQAGRKDYMYMITSTQKEAQLIFPKGTLGIFSRWSQAGTTYIATVSIPNPVTGKTGLTVDVCTRDLDWDLTLEEKKSLAQIQVSRVMRDNKKCTLEKLAYLGQLRNSGGQPQSIEPQTGSQAPLP